MAKNFNQILKKNWLGGILAIIIAYFIYAQKPHIMVVGFFAAFTLKTLMLLAVLYIVGAYIQERVK